MPDGVDEKKLSFITTIIKEVGLAGFIILLLFFVFIYIFTDNQQKEFIDYYILFKNNGNHYLYCSIIILALLVTLITSGVFFKKDLKLKDKEINRVNDTNSKLQAFLLTKQNND